MFRSLGIVCIVFLLLEVFGVQSQFCDNSPFKQCVPRQQCNEKGSAKVVLRFVGNGNGGCPIRSKCCNTANILPTVPPNLKPIPRECGHTNSEGVSFYVEQMTGTAQEGELPYMLALMFRRNNSYFGAGSLIAPDVVLTAQRPIANLNEYQLMVRAGEWNFHFQDEQEPHVDAAVRRIVRHPGFVGETGANNVALLFLANPFTLSHRIQLICLPQPYMKINQNGCFFSGWGKVNNYDLNFSNFMKKVHLPLVDSKVCEKHLQEPYGPDFFLDESLLCAGGEPKKDSCEGDGGAPLVCPLLDNPKRHVQIGIVNFGFGCGTPIPGVYTDVSKVNNWIQTQMRENSVGHQQTVVTERPIWNTNPQIREGNERFGINNPNYGSANLGVGGGFPNQWNGNSGQMGTPGDDPNLGINPNFGSANLGVGGGFPNQWNGNSGRMGTPGGNSVNPNYGSENPGVGVSSTRPQFHVVDNGNSVQAGQHGANRGHPNFGMGNPGVGGGPQPNPNDLAFLDPTKTTTAAPPPNTKLKVVRA